MDHRLQKWPHEKGKRKQVPLQQTLSKWLSEDVVVPPQAQNVLLLLQGSQHYPEHPASKKGKIQSERPPADQSICTDHGCPYPYYSSNKRPTIKCPHIFWNWNKPTSKKKFKPKSSTGFATKDTDSCNSHIKNDEYIITCLQGALSHWSYIHLHVQFLSQVNQLPIKVTMKRWSDKLWITNWFEAEQYKMKCYTTKDPTICHLYMPLIQIKSMAIQHISPHDLL